MKSNLAALVVAPLALTTHAAAANTAPTVVIKSATMRGATGLMDVVFRVNDPDDATVKTRALAFIDGQRSFAKVIKPTTFAEGTESKLGDAIASNTDHTLTWNVAADWNISLGQIKFEILAMDTRGLLPLDWVTIPAAHGQPELTISKNAPTDQQTLDALFWQYASGDTGLKVENGILRANATAGTFSGVPLVTGTTVETYGPAWAMRSMNLTPADSLDVERARDARASITDLVGWHALRQPYQEIDVLVGLGFSIPRGLTRISSISAGEDFCNVLRVNGTVYGWGRHFSAGIVENLSSVTQIAAGGWHTLALRSDGSVFAWGRPDHDALLVPDGLHDVMSVSAGYHHSLALKRDGTVIGWGLNHQGQLTMPPELAEVKSLEAGITYSLALKNDGTVMAWGGNAYNELNIPAGLTNVIELSAMWDHTLALKSDGTVVAWGDNGSGELFVPNGLSDAVAVAAGFRHSVALRNDGSIVSWGDNTNGQTNIPPDLKHVTAITAGKDFTILLKKAP